MSDCLSHALQALDAGTQVESESGAMECTALISVGGFKQR